MTTKITLNGDEGDLIKARVFVDCLETKDMWIAQDTLDDATVLGSDSIGNVVLQLEESETEMIFVCQSIDLIIEEQP